MVEWYKKNRIYIYAIVLCWFVYRVYFS